MAAPKPLRLKSERVFSQPEFSGYVVDVVVETPLPHLDGIYSYYLPQHLAQVNVGHYVKVNFNGAMTRAIIIKREKRVNGNNLKPVLGTLFTQPFVTPTQWRLIEESARHYGVSRSTMMNFALPSPASAKNTTRSVFTRDTPMSTPHNTLSRIYGVKNSSSLKRSSVVLTIPGQDSHETALNLALLYSQSSPVLVIVPDLRDIERIKKIAHINKTLLFFYTSDLKRTELFSVYQKALSQQPGIYLGTRSALWLPIEGPTIVLNDLDASMSERKYPQFHAREIALLRSQVFGTPTHFVSPAPSLETLSLVERGELAILEPLVDVQKKRRFIISTLPDSFHGTIKSGLKKGSVLINVAEKGYYNTILCTKCRNHPTCPCGGRFKLLSDQKAICALCSTPMKTFTCSWCHGATLTTLRKGSDRIAHEIGKAFPRIPIVISTRDNSIDHIDERSIVISTSGMEPLVSGGYHAIVFLDCEMILNRPLMRSEEFARLHWRNALSHLHPEGSIYFSLPNHHREVQALLSRRYLAPLVQEIGERRVANLPPFCHVLRISGALGVLSSLSKTLTDEFSTQVSTHVVDIKGERFLLVRYTEKAAQGLIKALADISRMRSAKKQELISLSIDPLDL